MKRFFLILLSFCLMAGGCSIRRAAYTAGGAAAGAGIGYSYHHNDKDAVIGGLAGGVAGAVLGTIEDHNGKKRYANGYEEGYDQAKVDLAEEYWDKTTGKGAAESAKPPKLKKFKVPEYEEDGVVYESHYVVLEDYR